MNAFLLVCASWHCRSILPISTCGCLLLIPVQLRFQSASHRISAKLYLVGTFPPVGRAARHGIETLAAALLHFEQEEVGDEVSDD
jgi:hypothetical protein